MLSLKICFLFFIIMTAITSADQPQTNGQSEQKNAQPIEVKPISVEPMITNSIPASPQHNVNITQNNDQNISSKVPQTNEQQTPPPSPPQSQQPQNANPPQQSPQQQRAAREKAQRQQLQQMRRKQQEDSLKHAQDSKISRYQQMRNRQKQEGKAIQNSQDYTSPKKNVLFQVDTQTEQFIITPTSHYDVILNMIIYTLENNAYGIIKDIDTEIPIHVYVYENNNRMIAEGEFYFEKSIKFLAIPDAYYSVRFRNGGQPKLVSFTYPNILQSTQIGNLYKKQHSKYHLQRLNTLSIKIDQVTQKLKRHSFLDRMNNELIMGFLKKYSTYQFIEMLFVLGVCAYQIRVVKKLFKSDSIF